MYKVGCTPKELSCLLSNIFAELRPICEGCKEIQDNEFVLKGIILGTDKEATIKVTDYGFQFEGDIEELNKIREKRCLYCNL